MTSEERERMNALIQRIPEEQDQNTFLQLVEQLNDLLDQTRDRTRTELACQRTTKLPKKSGSQSARGRLGTQDVDLFGDRFAMVAVT